MKTISMQTYIKPIIQKKSSFNVLAILAGCATAFWLYYCFRLLFVDGHTLQGTTSYGATWGIMVANIVHVIGISHVGIAISATVRVLNLERYRNVARIAEFVTLIALTTAVVNIGLDVGRPDRFIIETVLYGRWHAPMVWSMTVISLYFLASGAYLYLSMRRDFWLMSNLAPKWKGFYKFMTWGYEDTEVERKKHNQTLFWLAICLIPIMVSVHSVYGLFFGLLPTKSGWFNPLQAPYFVLGAIVSGFSAIIIVMAILRWAYSWQMILTDRIFKVFGIFLAFVIFLYLYFLLSEQLTSQYAPLPGEQKVSTSLLTGSFSRMFWLAVIGGLVIPFIYFFIQGVNKNFISIGLTTIAAIMTNIALWLKRFLIVVPGQYHTHLPLPRPSVTYDPTFSEMVVTFGLYAFAVVLFLVLLKVIPVIEMPVETKAVPTGARKSQAGLRNTVMLVALLAGIFMIVWGFLTRDFDYAPPKWLFGLTILVTIPLANCLIKDKPIVHPEPE